MVENKRSVTAEVMKARNANRKIAILEEEAGLSRKKGPWPLIERGVQDYGICFDEDLLGETLSSLVTKIGQKPNSYALGVLADEEAVYELVSDFGFRGGLAINLGYEHRSFSFEGEEKSVNAVNGDILSKKTWLSAASWLKKREATSFDLILSRGAAALINLPDLPDLHYFLMQTMWSLLNPAGGTMILQLPIEAEPNFRQWAGELEANNIPIQLNSRPNFYDFVAVVKRQKDAPDILPTMIGAPILVTSKMMKVAKAELH